LYVRGCSQTCISHPGRQGDRILRTASCLGPQYRPTRFRRTQAQRNRPAARRERVTNGISMPLKDAPCLRILPLLSRGVQVRDSGAPRPSSPCCTCNLPGSLHAVGHSAALERQDQPEPPALAARTLSIASSGPSAQACQGPASRAPSGGHSSLRGLPGYAQTASGEFPAEVRALPMASMSLKELSASKLMKPARLAISMRFCSYPLQQWIDIPPKAGRCAHWGPS